MRGTRSGGTPQGDDFTRRQGGAAWLRRFLAGAAIVASLSVAAVSWNDSRIVTSVPGGLLEHGRQVPGMVSGMVPAPARGVFAGQRVAPASRLEHDPGAGRVHPHGLVVLAAAEPGQDKKLEDWREEGIRMAAELTGIPEAFFRWLQDKGVPVGEFMRFLMPFLEWLEMVEPHNGTGPSPKPQPQDKPRETAV